MRALLLAAVLAIGLPGVVATSGFVESIPAGVAAQGFVDVYEILGPIERVRAHVAWSGDSSLALRITFPELGLTVGCADAKGSTISGARELTLDVAVPTGVAWANVYVHPGVVVEETAYAIAMVTGGAPAGELTHDDVSYTALPTLVPCLL